MKKTFTVYLFLLLTFSATAQYQVKSEYLQNPSYAIGYVDSCAKFWLHAYDSTYGGFFTNMDKTPTQYSPWGTEKNLQTQARDAYGFVRAFQLTGNDLYLYKARQALQFMYDHAWDKTNGGWYWELDNKGNPTSNNTSKDAFHQLYALVGIMSFFEATRDSAQWAWAMKGYANNENKMWDSRPQYFGYYNTASPNWSNKSGKTFNSTVPRIFCIFIS
jgi:mannobiose 2-epimerase